MSADKSGLKITLGSIATVIAISVAILPYLELKTKAENQSLEIKELRMQQKSDHDLIIEMAADIKYLRREWDRK